MKEKFCGGVPIDMGIPRIDCPLESSTSVIGKAIGVGSVQEVVEDDVAKLAAEKETTNKRNASIS